MSKQIENLPNVSVRALRFLNAAISPAIRSKMADIGFEITDLEEGWTLLKGVTLPALNTPVIVANDPKRLDLLDDWENKYYPLISTSIKRRYPAIHDALFLNLKQTSGPELLVTLPTLLGRLRDLKETKEGKEVLALLAKRGVDEAALDALDALLAQSDTIQVDAEARLKAEQAQQAARAEAIAALEAYLDEWETLARSVVTNKNHLRQLGLLSWRNPAPAA